MSKMELWPEDIIEDSATITAGATIEYPDGDRKKLWYRLPLSCRDALASSCDPFLLGVIFTAMRASSCLKIHGEVSPSLLENLDEFQSAWSSWRPDVYKRIDIKADSEREQKRSGEPDVVMAFSGGVDSTFTAWRHHSEKAGRQGCEIHAGVMVHGFDIPLADEEGYKNAADKAEKTLVSIGVKLIRMTTNFRDLKDNWEDAHGAGLASCLMFFQKRYKAGLIAASYPYTDLWLPYGSNPLTDKMFSSASFDIIHDGVLNRLEKLREIINWPEAMKFLRVCWEGKRRDRNCCKCQKCVNNMLHLRTLGQDLPECFEKDISNLDIIRMKYPNEPMVDSMERLLRVIKKENVSGSWVRALKLSVLLNRLRMKVSK